MDSYTWDVFICYASEDRDPVARPLAEQLSSFGLRVWWDEFELRIGDSLLDRVDRGLTHSRFGLVVLSKAFFKKNWPKRELKGLSTKELASSSSVVVPIWHGVTAAEVAEFSLPLADRVAARTDEGIDRIVSQVVQLFSAESASPFSFVNPDLELRYEIVEVAVRAMGSSVRLDAPPSLKPGAHLEVSVRVRNTGMRTWLPTAPSRAEWDRFCCGPVRIGTSSPRDHVGQIYDSLNWSWFGPNRPGPIPEPVLPRSEVTLTFAAVAPTREGSYEERFALVCDGYSWFNGPEISIIFEVT